MTNRLELVERVERGMTEKLEVCPNCGEIRRWLYDAQICAECGHDRLEKQGYVSNRSLMAAASTWENEARRLMRAIADYQFAVYERADYHLSWILGQSHEHVSQSMRRFGDVPHNPDECLVCKRDLRDPVHVRAHYEADAEKAGREG